MKSSPPPATLKAIAVSKQKRALPALAALGVQEQSQEEAGAASQALGAPPGPSQGPPPGAPIPTAAVGTTRKGGVQRHSDHADPAVRAVSDGFRG